MSERIVLIQNPNSTRAEQVQAGVVDPLHAADIDFVNFVTKYPDTEDNILDMRGFFREGDTILCAAGDGTGMQVANAVLREGHNDTRIGYLGYGNFNDLAHGQRNPLPLLAPTAQTTECHPLTLQVNGEYWRDAPAYMTMGFTAVAASQFGNAETRQNMRDIPEWAKLAASIGQLGLTYFKKRDNYLPLFSTSTSPVVQRAVTDVFAINSRRVGRIIKSQPDYPATDMFGYRTNDVSTIAKNLPFGLLSLAGHAPASQVRELRLLFESPSAVPVQTEGEFARLQDVSEFFVYKDPAKVLNLLRAA